MLVGTEAIVHAARRARAGHADPIRRNGRDARLAAALVERLRMAPVASVATPAPAFAVEGTPVKMPFGDLTVSEGKLVRWRVAEGQRIAEGALVAEIETDKTVVEIEAPVAGVVGKLLVAEGTVVKMGQTIAAIRGG